MKQSSKSLMALSQNLTIILEELRVLQKDFAEAAEISPSHLSEIVNLNKAPSFETLDKISNKIGVPTAQLIDDKPIRFKISKSFKDKLQLIRNH